ncbi:MAG: hypothetical protein QOE33_722 [Acidobacteriota bacterium]|nr:hypothetical protein [Acidobacteriota bacterium]
MLNDNTEKEFPQPEKQIQSSLELERYYEWLRNLRLAHLDFAPPVQDSIHKSSEFIDKELLWKQYQMSIDLYKHYLELVIKFNVFYYAITGAFLSYYFSHLGSDLVKWSLIFPIIMSTFSAWVSYRAARSVKYGHIEAMYIASTFGFRNPEFRMLTYLLIASGSMFVAVSLSLLVALVVIL